MKSKKMTDAYKNAIGTMFLLAGAFFICSTLLSMRTVLADPIAPTATATAKVSPARTAAARNATNSRSTVARTTTTRATAIPTRTNASNRNVRTRSISVRSTDGSVQTIPQSQRSNNTSNRSVASRRIVGSDTGTTMRGVAATRNTGRVVARTPSTQSRVSLVGAGLRASTNTGVSVSYLANKLYTGNYSNIIDSTTGLISADAYSNCLESYYTCMDEICTARSDTKGRCSCAGRATNFLSAEEALEKANEELISLSGQLALLISTKGKDVSEAFKLTDAEKVMNCVSWKELTEQYGTNYETTEVKNWCNSHGMYSSSTCTEPTYCKNNTTGSLKGFDIDNLNGSSSDILASLKAWANAKDLAKQYTTDDKNNLITSITSVSNVVNGLAGVTTTDQSTASLDSLANKWGYKLFEYAHNNVCGRVLDSCFNGIYEACGTPPSGSDSMGNKIGKCANGAATSCPYNYNSAISVTTKASDDQDLGEVVLNERGSTGSTTSTSATCFGYTSSSGDPYASLREPVADARRSIMQKYLLDANAACDTYGSALKTTAQNINYQKIAAEQALRQKRLEFYNEEESKVKSDAVTAMNNFDECVSEIWDCYNENSDQEGWTTARIKTYCAQVANVPHCYETMLCSTPRVQFEAIVDESDSQNCKFSLNRKENTCRNIVTLNEILYKASDSVGELNADLVASGSFTTNSAEIREGCIQRAIGCTHDSGLDCLRTWTKPDTQN